MLYLILILTFFSLFLLIKKYSCKYTWYFLAMVLALNSMIFFVVLYVSKIGNYRLHDSLLFSWDYTLYLYMLRLKVSFSNIIRGINASLAAFLFMSKRFVNTYTNPYLGAGGARRPWLDTVKTAVLPLLYVFLYDPNTRYALYIGTSANPGHILANQAVLQCITGLNIGWIIYYLFSPAYFMLRFYRGVNLSVKKKQILSLTISMMILNMLCLLLITTDPLKNVIRFGTEYFDLIGIPSQVHFPRYYYDLIPICMLVVVEMMLYSIIRFNALDTIDILREWKLGRSVKSLNTNLRNIFHSFKNTLFTIKILAKQAQMDYDGEQGRKAVDRIAEVSAEALGSMTRMLDSFKQIDLQVEVLNLAEVVNQAVQRVEFGENIRVEKHYICGDVTVSADRYHVTEMLVNILINAVEAVQNAERQAGLIRIEINAEYEWAIVKITDNGVGIDKKELNNIFQPFHTTKSRQKNWGVGLSYAYRIARAHFGYISVDSVKGEYTTFQILLFRKGV